MAIHPSAVVDPRSELGRNVAIGPHVIVEQGVVIGDDCVIDAFAVIKQGTTIGSQNHIFERAILGGLPQHLRMPEHIGDVRIGNGNTFRENTTVHRALHADQSTVIGDNNFMMVGSHIAHDCVVGNNTIFANNSMLAGHVVVEDRAYISGGVAVHQFCRVWTLAMVGGLARVTKDVPPFVTVDGSSNLVVGLNVVGLRRAGYTHSDITQLKAAYRVIYRASLTWRQIIDRLQEEFPTGPAAEFTRFLPLVTRGLLHERRLPPGVGVKLGEEAAQVEISADRKVG